MITSGGYAARVENTQCEHDEHFPKISYIFPGNLHAPGGVISSMKGCVWVGRDQKGLDTVSVAGTYIDTTPCSSVSRTHIWSKKTAGPGIFNALTPLRFRDNWTEEGQALQHWVVYTSFFMREINL